MTQGPAVSLQAGRGGEPDHFGCTSEGLGSGKGHWVEAEDGAKHRAFHRAFRGFCKVHFYYFRSHSTGKAKEQSKRVMGEQQAHLLQSWAIQIGGQSGFTPGLRPAWPLWCTAVCNLCGNPGFAGAAAAAWQSWAGGPQDRAWAWSCCQVRPPPPSPRTCSSPQKVSWELTEVKKGSPESCPWQRDTRVETAWL